MHAAGLHAVGSRLDLADQISGPTGEQAELARQAWQRVRPEPVSPQAARRSVEDALATCYEGRTLSDAEIARLGAVLGQVAVRDYAWSLVTRAGRAAPRVMDLYGSPVAPEAAAAPASLLAWTGWQTGRGALASLAIGRALEADRPIRWPTCCTAHSARAYCPRLPTRP